MPIRPPTRARSAILVEYPSRMSARVGGRIGMRHVYVALKALSLARPGTDVVIRPHPSDPNPRAYAVLAARYPLLRVSVDGRTGIEAFIREVDLCIGAVSTATLQALALGVPTVFLDVSGTTRPWPFDGAPDALPRATDADALAELLTVAYDLEPPGRQAAIEALGVRGDAPTRVSALIDSLL
jgi:hypothetical protein